NASGRELRPGKLFARIFLAAWRDIRVCKHPLPRDMASPDDVAAERDDGIDLRVGKIAIAEFVPRVDDLDADGARIDVGRAFPRSGASVPGALRFRHHLDDATVLIDEI